MLEIDFAFWLPIGIAAIAGILVYTYAIFPLAMAIVGRRQSDPLCDPLVRPDKLPTVSLIIPAHNEAEVIEHKIKNSLEIDYPGLEIIVANDGSTDRTSEIARTFSGVRLLDFADQRGKTSILADAVKASRGEVLCFCDANVMFRPDALWRLVAGLRSANVGGVTGDVRLQSEASSFGLGEALYYKLERCIHRGESKLGAVTGVDGGMYVIRRDLFCQLPADTVLDDFSISMQILRSGKKLLYEPTAIACENSTELALDEYHRRVRLGMGVTQAICRGQMPHWWQPGRLFLFTSHKLLRWMSPWLLLGLLIATIAFSFYQLSALVILLPGIALAGLALVGALSPQLRRYWIVAVPFYFTLSQIGLGWGMICGLLFNSSGIWSRTARRPIFDEKELG